MEWYWWVLIALAVAGIATLKLKVFSLWLQRRKQREAKFLEEE